MGLVRVPPRILLHSQTSVLVAIRSKDPRCSYLPGRERMRKRGRSRKDRFTSRFHTSTLARPWSCINQARKGGGG
jgi:hypothetical protein